MSRATVTTCVKKTVSFISPFRLPSLQWLPRVSTVRFRPLSHLDTCTNNEGYQRIVVEKPFGRDYNSSKELNSFLQNLFPESSIYVVLLWLLHRSESTTTSERRWCRTSWWRASRT